MFSPPQDSYEKTVIEVAPIYFANEYGKAWYIEKRHQINLETAKNLDKELLRFSPTNT